MKKGLLTLLAILTAFTFSVGAFTGCEVFGNNNTGEIENPIETPNEDPSEDPNEDPSEDPSEDPNEDPSQTSGNPPGNPQKEDSYEAN